jgi:tetratricopeptide (TPR) repeat protein
MKKTLEKLEKYISAHPERCFFNKPANEEMIDRVAMLLGIVIPISYRMFLLQHNGGCICHPSLAHIAQRDGFRAVEQECVFLLGLNDIFRAYQAIEDRFWREEEGDDIVYPAVPMCTTPNGEMLVFAQTLQDGEAPIFDAFHEEPLEQWGMLAPTFTSFLEDYIAADGKPVVISAAHSPTMAQYLPQGRWNTIPSESVDGEDAVWFWKEWLKFRPKDDEAKMRLSEALQDVNEHTSALFHLHSLAKDDPDDSELYEAMSDSYKETGNLAQALENIDTAIALEGGGSYLYSKRAEILFAMGRVDEARESCWAGIEEYAQSHTCYYLLGHNLYESGEIAEALEVMRIGVIACPNKELLLVEYADLLKLQGKYEEARELCDRALGLDNTFLAALITRESVNRLLGDEEAADADVESIEALLRR